MSELIDTFYSAEMNYIKRSWLLRYERGNKMPQLMSAVASTLSGAQVTFDVLVHTRNKLEGYRCQRATSGSQLT